MMIPKIIHYCWFGGKPLPKLALKCIQSWERFMPDYEIKRWDESNFDINIIPYTSQAYTAGKYAFVSDFARLWILYNYGGVYFDTDVEIIKPIEDIIERGGFMGCENEPNNDFRLEQCMNLGVNPGLGFGVAPGSEIIKNILDKYKNILFRNPSGNFNLTTIVSYTSEILCQYGLKNISEIQKIGDIFIYPKEYFCPIDSISGRLKLTPNTRSIHHYMNSWHTSFERFKIFFVKLIGEKPTRLIVRLKNDLKCRHYE